MQANLLLSMVTANDKADWDAYSQHHMQATAYHRFAWQEAVKEAYGHKLVSVIARSKVDHRVVGIFPAVLLKTPLCGKQICALPYCDVGYGIGDNQAVVDAMNQFLVQKMAASGSKKLEIRQVAPNSVNDASLANKKVRMLLALPNSSQDLMASFKSKLRSQIRKAEKNGLTATLGQNQELLDHFYHVYTVNMRDLGSPVHPKVWFQKIIAAYKDNGIISVVYKEDTPVGAGLVITNGSSASIPWASTRRDFNKLAPNMLLYWSVLAHCADNGISQFDFGRSTYDEGTYRFKKQWGAEPQLLNWQTYDANGQSITQDANSRSTNALRTTSEKLWRKLPLYITVKAGSLIRPYISL